MTMGVLWDTGDMEKASIYSVASEKGDAGAARADAAKRAGGARCGAGEARRATRIGAKGTLRTVDARVKIGLLVAYSVALFCTENLLGLGVAAALLAAVASVGDVPLPVCCAKGPSPTSLSASCSSTMLQPLGGLRESRWPSGCFCWYGRVFCSRRFPRLQSFPRRCAGCSPPWAVWGCPYATSRCQLSIALRFMPLLSEELRAVRAAQASRGAAFEGAGLVRRLRAYGGLMVPLFVGLFRRADRLASAMEARCYGASGVPTSLDGRRFAFGDGAALLVGVVACAAFALIP